MAALATAVLALPAVAWGGGWATVTVDPPLAAAASPGKPLKVELTILQHGRTPLEGVRPSVVVAREGGGGERSFRATSTKRPGVYAATLVFPAAGVWRYEVDDGFMEERHGFPPVQIGAPAAAPRPTATGDGGAPPWGSILAGCGGLLLALGVARRRRGRSRVIPAPVR